MLKTISAVAAAACLLVCLVTPFAYFYGGVTEQAFQWLFALASIGWFASATAFVSRK